MTVCPFVFLSVCFSVSLCQAVCLSLFPSICLSLSVCPSVCLFVYLCLSVCLSFCPFVCLLSVCLSLTSVCLFICLSVFHSPLSVCLFVCLSYTYLCQRKISGVENCGPSPRMDSNLEEKNKTGHGAVSNKIETGHK